MAKYLALTIGPIYETFAQVKKTRAVWAASYFFSWFIKQTVIKTREKGFDILLPSLNKDNGVFKSSYGSGLYADRIYFKPSSKTKSDLEDDVKSIVSQIAEDIDKNNKNAVIEYLNQYLNIHIEEVDVTDNGNVLKEINDFLDLKELSQSYVFDNDSNYLISYLEDKEKLKESILSKDAFGEHYKKRHFRSIPEIATTTLKRSDKRVDYIEAINKDFKNEETDLIVELKDKGFKILPFQKYYCVLYADGDNIGSLLKQLYEGNKQGLLQEFSKRIFEFGTKAEKILADYGGNGIYLGGEDVLAFLPVACINKDMTETSTVFKLIDELDECFKDNVGSFAEENKFNVPTLSYGITITYIKHPLKEAMQKAHDMMENTAKKTNLKNSIGLYFQKHSGQYIECCIEKSNTSSWKYIGTLVNQYTSNLHVDSVNKKNEEILSGVIQRLRDEMYFELFTQAAKGKRLEAFFENFFNEGIHKGDDNPRNEFLKKVRELSEKVFDDYPEDNKKCKDILFMVLRFIHFVNSEKE